jgi:hypothetical protein
MPLYSTVAEPIAAADLHKQWIVTKKRISKGSNSTAPHAASGRNYQFSQSGELADE